MFILMHSVYGLKDLCHVAGAYRAQSVNYQWMTGTLISGMAERHRNFHMLSYIFMAPGMFNGFKGVEMFVGHFNNFFNL